MTYDIHSYPPLPSQPIKPVKERIAEAVKLRDEMSPSKFYKMLQAIYESAREDGESFEVPARRFWPRTNRRNMVVEATRLRDAGEISTLELYKKLNAIYVGGVSPKHEASGGGVLTISSVQAAVAMHFNMTVELMLSSNKSHRIMRPRQIAMYLCRRLTKLSYPQLGCGFRRDHTSIIYAARKVEKLIANESSFSNEVETLKDIITL